MLDKFFPMQSSSIFFEYSRALRLNPEKKGTLEDLDVFLAVATGALQGIRPTGAGKVYTGPQVFEHEVSNDLKEDMLVCFLCNDLEMPHSYKACPLYVGMMPISIICPNCGGRHSGECMSPLQSEKSAKSLEEAKVEEIDVLNYDAAEYAQFLQSIHNNNGF